MKASALTCSPSQVLQRDSRLPALEAAPGSELSMRGPGQPLSACGGPRRNLLPAMMWRSQLSFIFDN
jgi:hypothetical protein